ncbi:hypothetical protein SLEP1_g60557, partial [Rubroshorea leprosula]
YRIEKQALVFAVSALS